MGTQKAKNGILNQKNYRIFSNWDISTSHQKGRTPDAQMKQLSVKGKTEKLLVENTRKQILLSWEQERLSSKI